MGICKCKKRTDLFCFVHKKAVCENCISTDHQTCVVKTYVEWLTDSDYDPPCCGVCKGDIQEGNVIRLTCLDTFHPECLDSHASTYPPHTAKAGYLCPVCSKPIFPTNNDNPIASSVNAHLSNASWASSLLLNGRVPTSPELSSNSESEGINVVIDDNTGSSTTKRIANSSSSTTNVISSAGSSMGVGGDTFGVASRKPAKDQMIAIDDEPEEDKYKKRTLMQLFTAVGIVQPGKPVKGRQSRIRLDRRRILVIFALISCLVTVILLGMNLTSEIEVNNEQPQ